MKSECRAVSEAPAIFLMPIYALKRVAMIAATNASQKKEEKVFMLKQKLILLDA